MVTWLKDFVVIGHAALAWLASWWRVIHLGALMLVLALSPSSHRSNRRLAVLRQLYLATGPILAWFGVLSALISLIVIRIVVVTALSYGLSQYALEMVVRVLVLELIPLTAALFAALRVTLPNGAEVAAMRSRGELTALARQGIDPLAQEVLPRVLAGMFAVTLLATVSCLLTLVLAYLAVHGFTLGGFERYTRIVGRVFSPAVALTLALKVFSLSLAVSLLPMASALYPPPRIRSKASSELQGLVRMFMLILLIEATSLVVNYY